MLESMQLAREIGDQGMYYWLSASGVGVRAEARDWDAHMELLREALETATVRGDRIRLRVYLAGLEATRGEDLARSSRSCEDMLGDSTDPDQHYFALTAFALAALVAGRCRYRLPEGGEGPGPPDAGRGGAAGLALRAAIWAGDHQRIRIAAAA